MDLEVSTLHLSGYEDTIVHTLVLVHPTIQVYAWCPQCVWSLVLHHPIESSREVVTQYVLWVSTYLHTLRCWSALLLALLLVLCLLLLCIHSVYTSIDVVHRTPHRQQDRYTLGLHHRYTTSYQQMSSICRDSMVWCTHWWQLNTPLLGVVLVLQQGQWDTQCPYQCQVLVSTYTLPVYWYRYYVPLTVLVLLLHYWYHHCTRARRGCTLVVYIVVCTWLEDSNTLDSQCRPVESLYLMLTSGVLQVLTTLYQGWCPYYSRVSIQVVGIVLVCPTYSIATMRVVETK